MLRLVPALTLLLFLSPVMIGLAGTLAPAFGYLPAIGARTLSLEPWRVLFSWPGFASSLWLTLSAGAAASLLSLLGALALVMSLSGTRWFQRALAALTPVLATPHAAIALGLAFLIAPSGWIVRLISPDLTGWVRPPGDLVTVRDPQGMALTLGLVVKEIPYLSIALAASLGQVPTERLLACAGTMGYRRRTAWVKLVLPQLWPQIRLPFYAVIAYSCSVVDQALVLGPGNPPPLAVLATRWFADYDLAQYLPAAAIGVLQVSIVVGAILSSYGAEIVVKRLGRAWVQRGARTSVVDWLAPALGTVAAIVVTGGLVGLVGLVLWSFASAWPFPESFPRAFSLASWTASSGRFLSNLGSTVAIAVLSTSCAVLMSVGSLEHEARIQRRASNGVLWLVYAPLLVPQIAFLFGLQVALVHLRLDGSLLAVVWAHLIYVLPYVFLSLADPYRALDPRFARSAACLGASPTRIFFSIKLPLLLRPVLISAAVGVAVSTGQYLTTVFAGGGRVATITTEALTLGSGADRSTIGVLGLLQSAVPLAAYALAIFIPQLVYRHRKGLI
jgi:putative thiamine transport system permease protein